MKNTHPTPHRFRAIKRGFTILEALSVMMVIGVVSSVAYLAVSSVVQRAEETKLRADVAALNRAVTIYVSNGGDIATAIDSQDVLARLKTKLSDDKAPLFVGLTSSMADVRIVAIYQSAAEAASNQLRTIWDPDSKKFVLGNAGDAAIKKFVFDDSVAGDESVVENRYHSTGFMYAQEDEWIWDFEDRPELAPTQITTVSIYFENRDEVLIPPFIPPTSLPPTDPTDPTDPIDPNGPFPLTPPAFTPDEGKFLYTAFPLTVSLTEYNPAGKAIIRYAINEGSFQTYNGPLTVTHDDTVRAYCASTNQADFLNSVEVNAFYDSVNELFAGQAWGRFTDGHRDGEVPVSGGTGSAHSRYQTTGNVVYYDDGNATVFEWGTPANGQPTNSLRFQGSTIVNIEPEQLFRVGQLNYYNGAVYSGSEAHEVTLNVDIDLATPDRDETFPIVFDLENTPNTGNADASADYVRMNSRSIPMQAQLNGKLYYLVVEFGNVTSNGFSSVNQFHVHENKGAMTSLYGYFTENPPSDLASYASTHPGGGTGAGGGNGGSLPVLSVSQPTTDEGGILNYVLSLSKTSTSNTVITYWTSNGSASNNDYTAKASQTVTIPPGQLNRTVAVNTTDDSVVELNETVLLNYSVAATSATTSGNVAIGTIVNNDTSTLSVAQASTTEGGTLSFVVSLSKPVDVPTNISYSTANGTANSPGDYTAISNHTLVIPVGITTGTISVQTTNDTLVEATENLYADFSATADGRSLAFPQPSATGTILDNDSANLNVANATGNEGDSLEFVVNLSNPTDVAVVVNFSTQNGTASSSNNDYTPRINGSVSIPAGQTTASIWIQTLADNLTESDETLMVNYTLQPTGRSISASGSTATGTIRANGGPATLTVSNPGAYEGNPLQFVVTLSRAVNVAVVVRYSTYDGTAKIHNNPTKNDYTPVVNQTVTIPAGQTTASIWIQTIEDNKDEDDEYLWIYQEIVGGGTAATLDGDTWSYGYIYNDD